MEQRERIEYYVLLFTVLIGGLVSILDFAGALDNITWVKDRIATLTLLLAALIAGSLLLGTHITRQFLKSVLPAGTIRQFHNLKEALGYVSIRIKEAKKTVCDLTLTKPLKTRLIDDESLDEYLDAIKKVSEKVLYREIVMFRGSEGRIRKARSLISDAGKRYQLAGYPDLPESAPPRWNFVIIDDEEVILIGLPMSLAIKQQEIVEYFSRYYDDLWGAALPIKIGDSLNLQLLEEAERGFGR